MLLAAAYTEELFIQQQFFKRLKNHWVTARLLNLVSIVLIES